MPYILPLKATFIGFKKRNFPFLIFQIGFNKCGTSSLYNFMEANGIASIHNGPCKWYPSHTYFYLNQYMYDNYKKNKTIFTNDCTDYFQFYSDFGVELAGEYYLLKRTVIQKKDIIDNNEYNKWIETWPKILAKQYSNAKYILNIRDVNNWLKSKYLHRAPYFKQHRWNQRKKEINEFIQINNKTKKLERGYLTDIDMLKIYKNNWYLYICNVLKYFEQNHIMHNLLIFNVETDPINKLIHFFRKFNLTLTAKHWTQKNKSDKQKYSTIDDEMQNNKWIEIGKKYPQFFVTNKTLTEFHRIINYCTDIF